MGPNTTAPDSAPSAASPPRCSSAIAVEEINESAKAANAIVFFMRVPPLGMIGKALPHFEVNRFSEKIMLKIGLCRPNYP
jgi:hypothetical protein